MRGLRLTRVRGVPLAGEALRFGELGRVILPARLSRLLTAVSGFSSVIREAARFNHMCACTSSCGTPLPLAYMNPRLTCALWG
jgi:hypothetical protein